MQRGFLPKQLPFRLVRLAANHPIPVLVVYAVLIASAAFFFDRLRIESDFLALVPEDNEVVGEFRTTVDRFGSIDMLLVGLEIPRTEDGEGDVEAATAYADFFAEEIRKSERINWVEYRLQDFISAAEDLLDRVTLFMKPDELDVFLTRFSQEGLTASAERLAERLRSPLDVGYRDLLVKDPLNAVSLMADRDALDRVGTRFHESGYLIDADETLLLMLVKPTGQAADLPFSKALKADLLEREAATEAIWREDGWEGEAPEVIYGGGYAIAVAEADLIVNDMLGGVVGSLIGVVVLFTFAFGRKTAVIISGVPLICGLAITFAFVIFALGNLNSATSAFAALLIGLGVDFIIVLYGRYLEERSRGATHDVALEAFGKHTAVGVLLGAVTTAATFFAFLISDFRGLSELGLLTGAGILILVVTVFLMLPALLTLVEKAKPRTEHRLHAFGFERLCRFSMRKPTVILAFSAVLTLVMSFFVGGVVYDSDVLNMRSPKNPGMVAQDRMMDSFGVRFTPLMIRVDAATEAELVDKCHRLIQDLQPLIDGENLARIDSILTLFPTYDQQREVLRRLDAFELDETSFRGDFDTAMRAEGVNPGPFMPSLETMLKSLTVTEPLSFEKLGSPAVEHLASRYLAVEDGVYSSMVYAYVPADMWRREVPPKLEAVVANYDNTIVTGPVVISIELKKVVLEDAMWAMGIGTLVVLLFLAWDLGGFRAGLFALLPLLMGMVWMLGAMTLLDLPVNFMNIFVFTMIIGIGVDYGIHLIHRWQESGGEQVEGTAKTIMIAAITTMMGFGSLAFSHYPGLRSLGLVAILGAAFSALIAISFLPALLTKFKVKL